MNAIEDLLKAYREQRHPLPDSDLDNEQPISLNVSTTLGAMRRLSLEQSATTNDMVLRIQELLDGVEWNSGTLEQVAEVLTSNGYRIRDMNDVDGEDDEPDDRCTNPGGHTFECSGTAYGGDDTSYHGEGRCYCVHCGADGDA